MKFLGALAGILVLVVLVTAGWQHFRYLEARRELVRDRQSLFYGPSTFHVVTLLKTQAGAQLLEEVGRFKREVESAGAKVVYAGKAVLAARASSQIPEPGWDAIVLTQFDDSAAYATLSGSPEYQKTLGEFEANYSIGMDRPVLLNLAIHQLLLGVKISDLVSRTPARYPFVPAAREGDPAQRDARIRAMTQEQEFGRDAVLIVNFLKAGTSEQQAENSGYGREMMGLMAEQGHGPMHVGTAVTLEGEADFDDVILVYYPGVDYMAQMVTSEFFTGIVGGKQLGDTHATATVPLLGHL
ncbi:MAG: hypothetical protein VX614_09270 [Myxococcota bacterium]|nr:hypothetical protein [Myxococcota bacterium]